MAARDLDKLTWPEVKAAIDGGRDTVVMALGATEQHGLHMPLATDALLGDHMAQLLAERIDAFVAPTLRVGCSEHHVGFAGTMSISEATMHAVIADLVRSLLSGGFRRIVLLPSHGGNFAPLAAALEILETDELAHVVAVTDLSVLFQIAQLGESEHGVPLADGGLHAGEWAARSAPGAGEDGARRGGIHWRLARGRRVDVQRRRRLDLAQRSDRRSDRRKSRARRALLERRRGDRRRAGRRPILS